MSTVDSLSTLPSSDSTTFEPQHESHFNIYYVVCEVLVAIFAVIGNALVIFVFFKERRLRRRTNYYIFSLALADFLVGLLGIPFAIMASLGITINLYACLFTVSLLVVLCTISIFCLVAVSVDRYWAILHPMGYSRNVRTKTALVIISVCWFAGAIVGFLPLMGWHSNKPTTTKCAFLDVMDYHYLVFLYFGTIITPALILAGFYTHIYQVVVKQLRQIVTMHPEKGKAGAGGGGTMIRVLGVAQSNEVKATQNLAIIVLFFMLCWIPLYTINCVIAFARHIEINQTIIDCCIILSHLNSAGNPLLYAYHLRDFRLALKNFFCSLIGKDPYCDQLNRNFVSNNNYSKIRYKRESASQHSSAAAINKFAAPKISKIVKNSTAVVAATAGEINRDIWNIPEDDSRSSDSSTNHDKMLMIRPATPYRSFMQMKNNSELNKGFLDNLSIESDDVFNEDTLPYHDYVFEDYEIETCLSDSLMKSVKLQVQLRETERRTQSLSSSSPQLTKDFFVDREAGRPVRSVSLIETLKNDKDNLKIIKKPTDRGSNGENVGTLSVFSTFSPLKAVNLLRYNRRRKSCNRSLSVDEGHVSMESLHRKSSNNGLNNSYES